MSRHGSCLSCNREVGRALYLRCRAAKRYVRRGGTPGSDATGPVTRTVGAVAMGAAEEEGELLHVERMVGTMRGRRMVGNKLVKAARMRMMRMDRRMGREGAGMVRAR